MTREEVIAENERMLEARAEITRLTAELESSRKVGAAAGRAMHDRLQEIAGLRRCLNEAVEMTAGDRAMAFLREFWIKELARTR